MAGKRRADGSASARPPKPAETSAEKQPKSAKTRVLKVLKWGGITGLVMALIGVGGFLYLYNAIDVPDANDDFETERSVIYYADGEELGKFAIQDRDVISYDDMPQNVKDAVVAAENRSFWTDNGIDVKGIVRAALNNASGRSTEGASTITQQLVKILYLNQEQSYTRKVKEAILALKIQRQLSKEEVLTDYLNTIYFGRGAYGIQAAAQAYFEKDAKDLNLRQAAVLASVLNDPNDLDPDNGKAAKLELKERYQYMLSSMADIETISSDEAEKAQKHLPDFPKRTAEDAYGDQKGHMLAMIRSELNRLGYEDDEIDGGGLEVTTTFTEKDMRAAKEGVLAGKPDGFGDKELHIGAASVEPGTGAVRGFYAGQDYLQSELNWAVEGGQAGSTFKPFAVATALDQGYSLKSTFEGNSPFELPDGSDVENQGDQDYGSRVSLLKATESSINTAFIDLTLALDDGPQSIIDMANKMGIPPEKRSRKNRGFPNFTEGLQPVTGVALGSQTVSPINMANAYATIANDGEAAEPYIIQKVVRADGSTWSHKVQTHEAISPDIASDVSYAMQQVVQSGSGTAALALGRPAAGKTGTATRDDGAVSSSWFAGFTPQLATAVMYVRGQGNEQLDGWLPEYFGGSYPAETWTEIMTRAMDGVPVEEFPEPALLDEEDPPSDEHAPYTPPPPPKTTKKPPKTESPTKEPHTPGPPTTETPTEPPTTEPTTPDDTCFLDPSACETDGNNGGGNDGGGTAGREVVATRETSGSRSTQLA